MLKPNKLFHISFQFTPEKIWHPKLPAGGGVGDNSEYDTPRICCSETLEGCFIAVYPNVSKYFEEDNEDTLDFYYYTPILKVDTKLLSPEIIGTRKYGVWDAHVTKEWDILTDVVMKPIGRISYKNTTKKPWIKTRRFNDPKEPLIEICPPVEYKLLPLKSTSNESRILTDW